MLAIPETETRLMERRRSRRLTLSVPIIIESLEPTVFFSGRCHSVDVSFHGCQFFLSSPFKLGTRLRLDILNPRHTISIRGHIVAVQEHVLRSLLAWPERNIRLWKIGVELTHPGNFWGVESPPIDWRF